MYTILKFKSATKMLVRTLSHAAAAVFSQASVGGFTAFRAGCLTRLLVETGAFFAFMDDVLNVVFFSTPASIRNS